MEGRSALFDGEFEVELAAYLRKHAPEKVANVPSLLQKYRGREAVLLRKVQKKYRLSN